MQIDEKISKTLTDDALIVLAEKLKVDPLAAIVDQFVKNGGDDVELSQAVSDVCKTITTKQLVHVLLLHVTSCELYYRSPSQDTRGIDPHSTASKLQPTASKSSLCEYPTILVATSVFVTYYLLQLPGLL